eukprot:gene38827-51040_t
MKLSLQELSPLYFRASTMLLGAIWLFVYVARRGERMWPARDEWATIAWLGFPNVLGWHTLSIFGVKELASGRAAILGFTMPIFTVLIGAAFFGERITPRVRVAVVCAGIAIGLLLWHELQSLSGRPVGIAWMLGAAFCWGLGTLMFRRAHFTLSPMVVTVWMLLLGSAVVWGLALALEPLPNPSGFSTPMWISLVYGVFINYGVAQLIWFGMARDLPPATSAMSGTTEPMRVHQLPPSIAVWPDCTTTGALARRHGLCACHAEPFADVVRQLLVAGREAGSKSLAKLVFGGE